MSFLEPGSEKKRNGTYDCKPDGSWNRTAEKMLQNFAGSGHPIFRCTSVFERGELRSKGGGQTSIHFNGSTQNIELLLQMVISVNQLSLYGAVADMIAELPVGQRAVGKPIAPGQLDKVEILTQLPLAEMQANEKRQGNLRATIWKTVRRPKVDQTMLRSRFESVEIEQLFFALPSPREEGNQSFYTKTMPGDQEGTRIKGWIQSNVRFGPVSDIKFAITTEDTVLKFRFNLCFKIKTYLGFD